MSSHNFILGYSSTDTVMLDFDLVLYSTVRYWADRAMNFHGLEGFIILLSSVHSYHVVFNRAVSWSENSRIMAWIGQLSGHEKLQAYHRMQCIKESSTLRVSSKNGKPAPVIVYREGKQDGEIAIFLEWKALIQKILECART